jgi:hypothetical protein
MSEDQFDQSLTERGLEIARDLDMIIIEAIESLNNAPLADRPDDDLAALWGEADENKSIIAQYMSVALNYLNLAIDDSERRRSKKNMFGFKIGLRSHCRRKKLPNITVSYEPSRRATRAEMEILRQLLDHLEEEDVVRHVRSCSNYFDSSCEQLKQVVERFI